MYKVFVAVIQSREFFTFFETVILKVSARLRRELCLYPIRRGTWRNEFKK